MHMDFPVEFSLTSETHVNQDSRHGLLSSPSHLKQITNFCWIPAAPSTLRGAAVGRKKQRHESLLPDVFSKCFLIFMFQDDLLKPFKCLPASRPAPQHGR